MRDGNPATNPTPGAVRAPVPTRSPSPADPGESSPPMEGKRRATCRLVHGRAERVGPHVDGARGPRPARRSQFPAALARCSRVCTHLLLLAPVSADPDAVVDLANLHGFRASRTLWEGEPLQFGEFALFAPEPSGCDCGTPIGSGHRAELDLPELEAQSRSGRRRHWSAARRRRWIEQRVQSTHRRAGCAPGDVEHLLQRWCRLANAAALDKRIHRIGILRHEAGDQPADWRPTTTVPATPEALLQIAPRAPTWLLPVGG